MLKGKTKRSLAFALAACMLLALLPSFGAGASAASVSYTEVDPSVIDTGTAVLPEAEQDAEQDVPAADEEVHVIILFEQKSLAKKGFSTKDLLEDEAAASYSSSLKKQQLSLVDRIEREALGGEELEIRYQFTIAVNGVATVVPYGRIEQILAVDGVADVYLEERYELDATVQPDTATAGEMVGSYSAWADGYTGAGSRIAIIDTGLDLSHPSFSEGGYYYSLGISAASFGKKISDYNLLTKEEIKKALPNLSISADENPPKADDLYRNAKVPFAYNYVDDGLDVSHDAEGDSNGDHGTHVAGIAAANRYVPHYDADGDLYYDKQELGVTGVAPDAQLVVMKVFGVGGGAYSSDYMAAIEDAIWLNCDSVNLSLGSGSAGRSYGSKSDQQILDSFRNTDTVVTVSAGNNGAWGENVLTGTGMTYTTDVRMHTGGSPGSYTNSFTIASVTNTSMSGVMGKFNGVAAIPGDTGETYGAKNFSTLDTSEDQSGTTYDYVFLGDPVKGEGIYGLPENYANVDVKGKVVLISRGNSSFADKANAAIQAGAAAAVIYNNAPGSINMNLTGYNFPNPAVMIEQSKAKEILAASTQDETTGLWGGKMTVSAKAETLHGVADGYKPSSFSSWGTTENLDLKPELMTPGGNIYSTLNHSSYGMMSGTSMAAPSAAGGAAIMAQYIKEHKLSKQEGLTVRALAMALMMSTSEPLTDPDTGVTYSPRQQGSGLMQLQEAVTSPAYLLVGEKEGNDGKVKLTFGDDAERTGVYTGSFSVQNLSDSPLHYALSGKVTTMAVEEIEGEDYMSDSAYALDANVTFSADGKSVYVYDLNGDDKVDEQDALVLLQAANGTHDALDAETERKAGVLFGIDAAAGEDVRMNHARAEDLDPALALAEAASLAAAGEAGYIDLSRRLGEREVVRTEADLRVRTEHPACEHRKSSLKIAHRNAAIDHKALDLVEERRMRCINRVGAVHTSGGEDADRRALLLHYMNLNGGGLRAKQHVVRYIEGVLRIACRMLRGNVQRLEVVVVKLDFGTLGDGVSHSDEDVLDLVLNAAERMDVTEGHVLAGYGDVKLFRTERTVAHRGFHFGLAAFDLRLDLCADLVGALTERGTLLGGE